MGLDIGLEQAGIEVVMASEIDKACIKTIQANRPDHAVIGDIRNYTSNEIRKLAGIKPKESIDLIVGGPPCQAFSTAGTRKGFEDERGNVFLRFVDLILELKPKFAVIENVRGLLSAPLRHRPHNLRGPGFPPLEADELPGGALAHIIRKLERGGYGLSFNLYNAANYGAPQVRERVVILCSRDGKRLPFLSPTHSQDGAYGLPKWRTFREAVEGLPGKPKDYALFPENRLIYYRMLKPGQYWKHLPPELQKKALGNSYYAGGGKTGFLRRLAWDKPSPTLVTHPAMPATDLAHPIEDRPLSVQEYKRIQEFPDDWVITGSITDRYRQIGNAVPASLGRAIGKALIAHVARNDAQEIPGFAYSRYKNTDDTSWRAEFKRLQRQSKRDQLELSLPLKEAICA